MEDDVYRQYVAKFGRTFNALGLSGEIWQAAEVLMQSAIQHNGPPVTLESILKCWRMIRADKDQDAKAKIPGGSADAPKPH